MSRERYYRPDKGYPKYDSHKLCYVDENDEPLETDNLIGQYINKKTEEHNTCCINMKIILYIVFTCLLLVSIFFDTYYGYSNNDCQNFYIPGININLSEWLKVSSYIIFFSCIIELITILYDKYKTNTCYHVINFIHLLIIIFILSWTVFGSYIFWHNYYKSELCTQSFIIFMFINLISINIIFFTKLVLLYCDYVVYNKQTTN